MAYLKHSTFALIALVLIATASVGECQSEQPVTVTGFVTCDITPIPQPGLDQVEVFLSCDNGRTAVAPPARPNFLGIYSIAVSGPNATLVNTERCATFVLRDIPGCPALAPGEVYRAPLIELSNAFPIFNTLRFILAAFFSITETTV